MGEELSHKEHISILNLEPGVIDTPMQNLVRKSDSKVFPKLSKFLALHENGELLQSDLVAKKIYSWCIASDKLTYSEHRIKKDLEIPTT